MNKDDVIRHLTRHVLDKKQAKMSVDTVFEIIKHGLKRDGKVVISNFGTFHLKTARPVTRRNPKRVKRCKFPPGKRSVSNRRKTSCANNLPHLQKAPRITPRGFFTIPKVSTYYNTCLSSIGKSRLAMRTALCVLIFWSKPNTFTR